VSSQRGVRTRSLHFARPLGASNLVFKPAQVHGWRALCSTARGHASHMPASLAWAAEKRGSLVGAVGLHT
jgi:hypothetical protein